MTMTKTEYLALTLPSLKTWAATYADFKKQMDALDALTCGNGGPLYNAVWGMWDEYTRTLADLVGDTQEWLAWFQQECQMGAKPKEVSMRWGHSTKKVRTLRQLADVMWECRP